MRRRDAILSLALAPEVPPAPTRPRALPRVFVEFPVQADRESANRMYGSAAVAVVERGFELVGAVRRAQFLVCLSPAGEPMWLSTEAAGRCDPHALAAAMPWSAMARPASSAVASAQPSQVLRGAEGGRLAGGGASAPLGWRLGLAGGVMARGNHLDPSLALSLRLGRDDGLCGVVLGRFTPVEDRRGRAPEWPGPRARVGASRSGG